MSKSIVIPVCVYYSPYRKRVVFLSVYIIPHIETHCFPICIYYSPCRKSILFLNRVYCLQEAAMPVPAPSRISSAIVVSDSEDDAVLSLADRLAVREKVGGPNFLYMYYTLWLRCEEKAASCDEGGSFDMCTQAIGSRFPMSISYFLASCYRRRQAAFSFLFEQ